MKIIKHHPAVLIPAIGVLYFVLNVEFGIIYLLFTIGPVQVLLLKISKNRDFAILVSSIHRGVILSVVLGGYTAVFLLLVSALQFHFLYKPQKIRPRLVEMRNKAPFLLASLAMSKLLLISLDIDFFLYNLEDDYSTAAMLNLIGTLALLLFLYELSNRSYENLKAGLARNEQVWTNNVLTLLSHNIRTPISSIGSRIDILKLKLHNNQTITIEDVNYLEEDRNRVNSIVNSLLSKSSRSIIANSNREVTSFSQIIETYAERTVISGLVFHFKIPTTNAIAMDLALESCISNSEKYGAKKIEIRSSENTHSFLISVIDDGEGMDMKTKSLYGTPFNNRSSRKGGSGLGVYFSLQLILNAGWDWSVESAKGEGTTITFNIPKSSIAI